MIRAEDRARALVGFVLLGIVCGSTACSSPASDGHGVPASSTPAASGAGGRPSSESSGGASAGNAASAGGASAGSAANAGGAGASSGGGAAGTDTFGPVPDHARRIAISELGGCAVMHHQAYCWGSNAVGQLGVLPTAKSPFSSAPTGLPPVAGVAFSGAHACALTLGGEVYCWGANGSLQAGDGTSNAADGTCLFYPDRPELGSLPCQPQPTRVAGISRAVDVAVSGQKSCAVLADGTLRCWGDTTELAAWIAQVSDATSISLSQAACVTKRDGSLDCNFELPSYAQALRVERISIGRLTFDFSSGVPLLCGLGAGGSVTCIGVSDYGGLGIGDVEPSPTLVPAISSGAKQVASGEFASCALSNDAHVRCWGDSTGPVGRPRFASPDCGLSPCESTPREVEGLPKVAAVDAYGMTACALGEDDSVWCWGYLWPSAPARVAGPWEANGAACAPLLDRARAWRDTFNGPSDRCVTAADCAVVPLALSCDATCGAVSAGRANLASIQSEQAQLEAEVCTRAAELGCAGPSLTCPSQNHLRATCLSGECILDDPTRTGCTDACLCAAARLSPPAEPKCQGFDLFAMQTATCGTCDGSGIYVVVQNRGSAAFSGSAVVDFLNTQHAPSAKTLTLTIPAGGHAAPIYFESLAKGEGTVRVAAPGDCNPDDTWGGISFPEPAPLCR